MDLEPLIADAINAKTPTAQRPVSVTSFVITEGNA